MAARVLSTRSTDGLQRARQAPAPSGRIVALLVSDNGGSEHLVRLGEEPLLIGRDEACGIRLESPFVSRLHARVEQQSGGTMLVDLDSHNGCFLNDRRVRRAARLGPGDVIGIADVAIRCLAELSAATPTQHFDRATLRHVTPLVDPPPTGAGPARRVTATARPASTDRLRVQERTHQVWLGKAPPAKRLSAQEFRLLAYLYQHRDRVCTRQELGDAIWGADNWDLNMLYHLAHRLKDKLEPEGSGTSKPRYVQTIPQIGYRITP